MLHEILDTLHNAPDQPLWLPDLHAAFSRCEERYDVIIRQLGHNGEVFDLPCPLPIWHNEDESALIQQYLNARIYNLLSARSARELQFYYDPECAALSDLIKSLDESFQLMQTSRSGLGKVVNIAERMARAGQGAGFRFSSLPISEYRAHSHAARAEKTDLAVSLKNLAAEAEALCLVGIDVGGTDIKLAASKRGKLVCLKEYDWNPAASPTAEGIVEPILLLTRLMRACIAFAGHSAIPPSLSAALDKSATDAQIRAAVEEAERALGERIDLLDGVGLSFPDIVIDDRIVGGETPKTDGMRKNRALDYETEFGKIRELREALLRLCRSGGRVRLTNDGNMAAFTAAMELSHSAEADAVCDGVVAHTLGTDLGSGWLQPDGTIPPLPLEMYDFIIDVGSRRSAAWPPQDLRSTKNENSGLAGARRYMGQAAAYRLAQKLAPELLDGFRRVDGNLMYVPTAPLDLRKPCLEHLMQQAQNGVSAAEEIFRQIGEHLAVLSAEMDSILHPESKQRFLYGRFVKTQRCFELLCEGFARRDTGIKLRAADEELACTPLMRQLANRASFTVAQFGQAVGSIYFALS
ncbi:MAG: ROK family protein [Oscillospiraceae bacterium]|nr:ROK family protein [Oscillospiraceae bacterium]